MSDEFILDAEKLLILWQDDIPVPDWEPTESGSQCSNCKDRLGVGHRHHCRLCGKNFCSACTGLYHVQKRFQRHKGDDAATRVCWGCRDICLVKREMLASKCELQFTKSFGIAVIRKKKMRIRKDEETQKIYIHVPNKFDVITKQSKCFTCGMSLLNENFVIFRGRTCRVCGESICSGCSSKNMNLPTAFKKASQKSLKDSKCRVCHECRYLIIQGAILDGSNWNEENSVYLEESKTDKTELSKSVDFEDHEYYSDDNVRPEGNTEHTTTSDDSGSVENHALEIEALKNSMDTEALLLAIIENSDTISYAEAIHDFDGKTGGSMKFSTGNRMKIIKKGTMWWLAVNLTEQDIGWIPPNYVKEEAAQSK